MAETDNQTQGFQKHQGHFGVARWSGGGHQQDWQSGQQHFRNASSQSWFRNIKKKFDF